MNQQQFSQTIKFFNDKHEEFGNPREEWTENTRQNLPRITKKSSVWNLHGLLEAENEKAVVIVGASPSLLRDMEELKKLDRNHFLVIVVNSALKPLLDNGIKPDFVIAVDGNPRSIVDDLDCDNEDLKLICSNNVCPKIFDVWKGKEIYWLPYYAVDKNVRAKVRYRIGKQIGMGGNTFSAAMAVAYLVFGAKIFVLVGSELCYDKQYYAHKKSKWEKPETSHFVVTDIQGRKRYTNLPLFQYKMWMERMMTTLSNECHFYDTSYGLLGTDCDHVYIMPLKDANKSITDAFNMKKQVVSDWRLREKMRYDAAYNTMEYVPKNAKLVYPTIMKVFKGKEIKTALDVGCGVGQGVALMRNKGIEAYGIDISEKIKSFWEMGNISQFCQVTCADNIPFKDNYFDLVVCTEVLEHVPEEGVTSVLKEMFRVCKKFCFFTIAITKAVHKMPYDGSEPHICVKPPEWWKEKMESIGYRVFHFGINYSQSSVIAVVGKGKFDDSEMSGQYLFSKFEQKM
jgi:ubiquinone/menaquinone biosynthesis C-methylase UbiE